MTSASASRRAYVLSGRRPKPDIQNLINDQAHAPLGRNPGHARMLPGRYLDREFVDWGSDAPPSGFHRRRGDHWI